MLRAKPLAAVLSVLSIVLLAGPVLACPFCSTTSQTFTEEIDSADAVVIDVHCETTSEKCAMGHFADGSASLVVGTHTHNRAFTELFFDLIQGYGECFTSVFVHDFSCN